MLHNKIVKDQGMKDLSSICAGDKIRWVYLKQNKFGSDVIAFNDKDFLKRIKIADKVDLKLMFEKTYLSPLEKLIEAVGWKMNNQALIMDSLF
jgi:DNA polymerase elongation subunit (family B)